MTLAVVIFAGALAVIASERVDRTKVALVGALLVVLTQTIDQEHAIEAVDWETIGLLAGMMLIVRVTEPTGVYTFLAIRAGQFARGRPLAVVMSLAFSTAVLSAFLDNLTTVLLMVPITFLLADALDIDPIPLVLIEIIASNIGGTATLIGDPPNILIAGATDLTFGDFFVNLAPIAAVAFVVVTAMLYLVFRRRTKLFDSCWIWGIGQAKVTVDRASARRPLNGRKLCMRRAVSLRALLACCFVLLCSFAASASAQAPPNLSGEALVAQPEDVDVTCEGSASGFAIRWSVSGVATGPYPGTFTETGSHTGPGTDVIEASFRIESPAGTVTGTKRFVPPAAGSALPCGHPLGAGSFGVLRYEATIVAPAGRFTDQGSAEHFVLTSVPGSGTGAFNETFASDMPTQVFQCSDAEDNDCLLYTSPSPRD